MGSWNGTCGVSQLPIISGDKVRLFILIPNQIEGIKEEPNSFVYSTDLFRPLGLPIRASYSDYGAVEDIEEDFNTKIIFNELKSTVVLPRDKPFSADDEVETDDNDYLKVVSVDGGDITVIERNKHKAEPFVVKAVDLRQSNRENFYDDMGDLQKTIELIERNVIEQGPNIVNRFYAKPGLFMVRENVFQAISADIKDGDDFRYKTIKQMGESIDEFIKNYQKLLEEEEDDFSFRLYNLEHVEPYEVGRIFSRSGSEGFNATLYKGMFTDLVKNHDVVMAKKLLQRLEETSRFMDALGNMRKPVIPQCGAGSQAEGIAHHTALLNITESELHSIKHRWDEEDEEDEEWAEPDEETIEETG